MDIKKEPVVKKFLELVKTIKEYESDTFSASAVGLKRSEALRMASAIACHALQELIDCDTLDGVRLTEELENIRD